MTPVIKLEKKLQARSNKKAKEQVDNEEVEPNSIDGEQGQVTQGSGKTDPII